MRPRLSVALCTFEGARFLPKQLESLVSQTCPFDELVACDDGSTDGTVEILADFARHNPFPVRLVCNPKRLGVVKNFEQAISLCSGELIALADQDDTWHDTKLECLLKALAEPGVGLAFSDAEVVDERSSSLGYTMWQRVGFNKSEQERMVAGDGLGVMLKHFVVTGATLAFRANLRSLLLPLPPQWPHDAWIAAVASAVTTLHPLNKPLVKYRQHGNNVVGGKRISVIEQGKRGLAFGRDAYYRTEIERFQILLKRLQTAGVDMSLAVEAKLAHLHIRAGLPQNRLKRLPGIISELSCGGYRRYARNWESAVMDMFFL